MRSAVRTRATVVVVVISGALVVASAAVAALIVSNASPSVVQRQPAPGTCHARGSGIFSLPDRHCTPGAISPAVTQANIASTICRAGYTETVRPSESVTEPEKRASLAAYGDRKPLHYYEYDHLVPLELGGASNDPRNLWPEPGAAPNVKDSLENRLNDLVCSGTVPLATAQREIAGDWVAAYHRLIRGAAAVAFPPGVYGVIAIPSVHVSKRGALHLSISCPKACRGTVKLVGLGAGGPGSVSGAITRTKPFRITAAKGGTVAVLLYLNNAGLKALRASHHDLQVNAVMRYPAAGGYPAQTDTYPVTLT
ncbi:MAG: hypothetical protein ACYDHH_09760 [Solirubrobacteraceae bacterium]